MPYSLQLGTFLALNNDRVPFKRTPNRGGWMRPSLIVLHDTAGRLNNGSSVSWMLNPRARASAHLCVERDGSVTQLLEFDRQAWHAGKSKYKGRSWCNKFSIGIEIVNPGKMSLTRGGGYAKAWWGQEWECATNDCHYAKTRFHGRGVWMGYTPAQVSAVRDICELLVTELKLDDITTHYAISPRRKVDVNPMFPLDLVRKQALGQKYQPMWLP